ncbi:MAG: alpha-L-arabinofuranosidase [Actinobacteria bacterium]|nr:alpha-L-arabinofuranosidase [Actinomycetota bacterium]
MRRTTVTAVPQDQVAPVHRRLFGSFVEHMGRCVYGGIYEPGHPTADADGFRGDVAALVRELGVTTVRYPGGNFVSGYRWEDGVGPREQRPVRRDLAWHSIETNQVGLDEFAGWARDNDLELMLAVNLGTRGVLEALDLLEYTNGEPGTTLADQRVAHGSPRPHDVRIWCLGNEMDGPWQIGHLSAHDYGTLAARTAAAMKRADSALELVACGSSNAQMPTFGAWERTVLEQAWDHVDLISLHAYYEQTGDDLASFLASGRDMDHFIDTVVATVDHVGRGSAHQVHLSFDEWNVWRQTAFNDAEQAAIAAEPGTPRPWPTAPHLLEEDYRAADAVLVGSLLITLLRHADRVHAASLAQLVNVIAPIRTEPGGPAWRQSTFHPFALTARLARGVVLRTRTDSPTTPTTRFGEVSAVDAVITWDEEPGTATVLLVNRGTQHPATVDVDLSALGTTRVLESHLLHEDDVEATNSAARPDRVSPHALTVHPLPDGVLRVELPPVSWAAVAVGR